MAVETGLKDEDISPWVQSIGSDKSILHGNAAKGRRRRLRVAAFFRRLLRKGGDDVRHTHRRNVRLSVLKRIWWKVRHRAEGE
jgi:hypothetical protein